MGKDEINVLVTGVGAIIGYGIIKSIRMGGRSSKIFGTDIYSDAVGQHWCDEFIQAPYAVSDEYISFLSDVIVSKKIDIVFFGTEQEIYKCVDCRQQLGDLYEKLVINRPSILNLSRDKWEMQQELISRGLQDLVIPSVINGDYEDISRIWGDRFILKPRSSYASKGIHVVNNRVEFDFYRTKMGAGFMAQEIVGDSDNEFTVGTFGLGDGSISGMIQLRRKLSQEGATSKASTINDESLANAVKRICRVLNPIGPTNLQFRKHEGAYKLLEVNPRISSSTSIRAAFGYNEAIMSIDYYRNNEISVPIFREGYALRFIDDCVIFK